MNSGFVQWGKNRYQTITGDYYNKLRFLWTVLLTVSIYEPILSRHDAFLSVNNPNLDDDGKYTYSAFLMTIAKVWNIAWHIPYQ